MESPSSTVIPACSANLAIIFRPFPFFKKNFFFRFVPRRLRGTRPRSLLPPPPERWTPPLCKGHIILKLILEINLRGFTPRIWYPSSLFTLVKGKIKQKMDGTRVSALEGLGSPLDASPGGG